MHPYAKLALSVAGLLGLVLLVWVGVAAVKYWHDAPAREYARNYVETAPSATSTQIASVDAPVSVPSQTQLASQTSQSNPWLYFFFGYMLGGNNSYSQYRQASNNTYYSSPVYETVKAEQAAQWGSSGAWDTPKSTGAGTPSSWSSSNDSGSWSSSPSSWSSSGSSGSWGGSSSWGSGSSGSWGGSSGSSWGSGASGSWGD